MAVSVAAVIAREAIAPGIVRLTLCGLPGGAPGQFFMLHMDGDGAHILPRPISLFDYDEKTGLTRFVFRVAGRGTELLSRKKPGDALTVTGPLGNGFPTEAVGSRAESNGLTVIGGGLGVAPLYALVKAKRAAEPSAPVRVYLGYSDKAFLKEEFEALGAQVFADVGGYVTDLVDFTLPGAYCACGPEPMLRAAAKKARAANASLFVSLERRMGCGVGACFACSVQTRAGNRRVCKNGPVFPAGEVLYE